MISICIPVYNYSVLELARDLADEANNLRIPIEILFMDDASNIEYRSKNEKLNAIENVRYIQLVENVGRAKIRNLLAAEAKYTYLLFLDCDAQAHQGFLKEYIDSIVPNSIIIGGVAYSKEKPHKDILFRWRYGIQRESTNASERSKRPYSSFKTFNFLIPKSIFESIKFEESLTEYGHEDTLFGIALKKNNIPVIHIQNPLIHLGLESNSVFLKKTETGIDNLFRIYNSPDTDSAFGETVSLLKAYKRLPNFAKAIISFKFKLVKAPLKWAIISGKCPIKLFDLYKIGYLCTLKHSKL